MEPPAAAPPCPEPAPETTAAPRNAEIELWIGRNPRNGRNKRSHRAHRTANPQKRPALGQALDYTEIHGLKNEARAKFAQIRPATLGQAARISGITPADIALLSIWIERG